MSNIQIEFFHDVICSFCYPMSFRMRQLAKMMPEIEIVHRSFALVKTENDFIQMFGSREQAKNEIISHWDQANRNDDLHRFNIEGMKKETFLFPMSMKPLWACKAAYYTGGQTAYWDVFDALQKALFTNNLNIESDSVLFNCIKELPLNFDTWLEHFPSNQVQSEVENDLILAEEYGIQSIPTLVINKKYKINGAVSLEKLVHTINNIQEINQEKEPANESCGIDGCS